ncbi:MAG: hypothetical protein ACREXK_08110 [Gammaproteobacteria bacterium]
MVVEARIGGGDRLREYEARVHPWGEAEPVEALRYLMRPMV